ncbi:MAG: tryptophan-rich sensory protein [Candidatus Marinimicrobia bacterium]|nr:tryptophan-rich sensory protein [Candidatus Neomarinimicrobiota bacterium]
MNAALSLKTRHVLLASLNILFYAGMLAVNALANALPINGLDTGDVSAQYPNLFVPAGITFSIWALIYLLLFFYVVYGLYVSLTDTFDGVITLKTQIIFSLTCLVNAGWIFLWHYKLIFLSELAMLLFLALLIRLFLDTEKLKLHGFIKAVAVKIPVSVYLGWITVATIANTTALLVARNWGAWGIPENIWTMIMMTAALVLAVLMLYKRGNIAYSLVVAWALIGIILKRTAQEYVYLDIVTAAYAILAVLTVLIVITLIKRPKVKPVREA